MPTVKGTNYLRVTTTAVLLDSTYDLTLEDLNGNVFPETTILLNAAVGTGVFNLPEIASLGPGANNCRVVFIVTTLSNSVTIDCAANNQIGLRGLGTAFSWGGANLQIGETVIFTPVDGITWEAQTGV